MTLNLSFVLVPLLAAKIRVKEILEARYSSTEAIEVSFRDLFPLDLGVEEKGFQAFTLGLIIFTTLS